MKVSDFFWFPVKISGVSPYSLPVCLASVAGAAIITASCGTGDCCLCGVSGGGDGTLSPATTASSIS